MESLHVTTALLAGAISFLSPCVLPLVPGYMAWMTGQSRTRGIQRRLIASVFFVLGFSTIFIAFGAAFSSLSHLLLRNKALLAIIGGVFITFFGLLMAGVLKIDWLARDYRFHRTIHGGGPTTSYLLGLAFAFGWTPCIGPVLGAILTLSAATDTAQQGMLMLAYYSLGLGLPFILAALFTGSLSARLGTFSRTGAWLYKVAGVVMALTGVALATGWITRLGTFLLDRFPIFAELG